MTGGTYSLWINAATRETGVDDGVVTVNGGVLGGDFFINSVEYRTFNFIEVDLVATSTPPASNTTRNGEVIIYASAADPTYTFVGDLVSREPTNVCSFFNFLIF